MAAPSSDLDLRLLTSLVVFLAPRRPQLPLPPVNFSGIYNIDGYGSAPRAMAGGSAGHDSPRALAWIPMRCLSRRCEGGHPRNLAGGRGWAAPRFFALPLMLTGRFRRASSWEGVHHRGAAGEEMRIHRRTPSSLYGPCTFIPVLNHCPSEPNLTWWCEFLLGVIEC
ncbi:hypothetical protein ACQJBY_068284 [Aegilops geniculata]